MEETLSQGSDAEAGRSAGRPMARKLVVLVLTMVVCLACDRLTKNLARRELPLEPRSVLGGLIRLEFAENRGAFMSLGSALPEAAHRVLLLVLAAIVVGVLAVLAFRAHSLSLMQFTALSCIAAGGCGNLIDRMLYDGRVVDWVSVGFKALRTGVFNLADVAVIGGGLVYLLSSFRESGRGSDGTP
jgi:signal peptidase II